MLIESSLQVPLVSMAVACQVVLKGCNINSGVLAKFDADSDFLSEELQFTFEDFEIPESFEILDGMN